MPAALRQALAAALGDAVAVAGNRPLLLDRADSAWLVLEGEVDLFLVPLEDGRPAGLRQHLFAIPAGGLLFGLDGSDLPAPVGLLAVGQVGSVVAELPVAALRALPDLPPLAAPVEAWARGLSLAMARPIAPRPRLVGQFRPGERIDPLPGQRIGCAQGLGWVTLPAPGFFLDTGEVAAGETLPLAAGAWLELTQAAPLASRDTAAALATGAAWDGLALLHRQLLEILPLNLRLAAVDEANRLRARAEADLAAGRAALDRLAAPLAAPRALPAEAATDSEDPLSRAVGAVVAALGGVLVPPPPRRLHGALQPPGLDDILRANGLRSRPVQLEAGWWRRDAGPLLLLRPAEPPLALLPQGARGGWRAYDPVLGQVAALSSHQAAALRGEALSLTLPLPARPLGGFAIIGRVLRDGRGEAAAMLGLGLAAGVLNLGLPLATGVLVDTVIPAHDLPKLVELGLVLGLLAAVMLLLRYAVQIAALRLEGHAGSRLQAAILDRLLRLPMRFFRDHNAGVLAKRALAIQAIQQAAGGAMIGSLMTGGLALISLGIMAWYSPALTLVALACLLVLLVPGIVLGWLRLRQERDVVRLAGDSAGLLLQLATGIAKLRLAAAEHRAFLRWSRLQARLARQRFLAEQTQSLAELLNGLGLPLATAALFCAIHALGLGPGAGEPGSGLALGALLGFLNAFSQCLGGLTALMATAVQIAGLRPVYAYAAPILQAVPETGGGRADPGRISGAVELSRLTFRYAPDAPALFDDLSVNIAAGEYVAVVGPSGSGKSTLLRLLLGFETPQSGAVLYDGQDLQGLDPQALRRQLGVVLQGGRLLPGSLLDNILGPNLHLTEAEAWAAADQVGLGDDIRAMPMRMQTVISDSGSTLSGGQVQRVLLARAVVARPRILLLDEATSALDNRTQAVVTESLDRLNATRLVIAHRLSTVVHADRILVMNEGRIVESGSFGELMERGGVFRELAERQLV
ncbi:NHLP bacteriocin export ABC transporter permease/ATPase subunit [Roseomonas sp. 18066]|uniref:NHLP bacteriocin export ABC transporter permease/ATPase subunit n=1 Tax=Roseomonas sp. 18066 TaxID=2681412 RepID=UPI0013593733|nr:NHLP bacteriocin export ABC transporter permease/ATPase subunit [Roseomonas sp. 18066]